MISFWGVSNHSQFWFFFMTMETEKFQNQKKKKWSQVYIVRIKMEKTSHRMNIDWLLLCCLLLLLSLLWLVLLASRYTYVWWLEEANDRKSNSTRNTANNNDNTRQHDNFQILNVQFQFIPKKNKKFPQVRGFLLNIHDHGRIGLIFLSIFNIDLCRKERFRPS